MAPTLPSHPKKSARGSARRSRSSRSLGRAGTAAGHEVRKVIGEGPGELRCAHIDLHLVHQGVAGCDPDLHLDAGIGQDRLVLGRHTALCASALSWPTYLPGSTVREK